MIGDAVTFDPANKPSWQVVILNADVYSVSCHSDLRDNYYAASRQLIKDLALKRRFSLCELVCDRALELASFSKQQKFSQKSRPV